MSSAESSAARVWERVDALIDRASSLNDLRSHRLELLAARRFRGAEKPVPAEFAVEEKLSAINSMATPVMLERIAGTLDRPAVVMKGPEVATFYPDPSLRG